MGKYDRLMHKLAPLPPEDSAYQHRVDQVKARLTDGVTWSAEGLGKAFARMTHGDGPQPELEEAMALARRLGKKGIESLLSLANLELEAIEQLLLEGHAEGEPGWGAYGAKPNVLRLASGGRVEARFEPAVRVLDKEAVRQWCLTQGLEKSMHLWPSTLAAIVKERLMADEVSLPPGVEVGSRWTARFVGPAEED